jgi:alpha-tubulin suppressor-like RCC1 family protein
MEELRQFYQHPDRNYISAGYYHTVILLETGEVYTCGYGIYGQLGTGKAESQLLPVPMQLPHPALAVSARSDHTVILLETGEVYTCGYGHSGKLGTGTTKDQLLPVRMHWSE